MFDRPQAGERAILVHITWSGSPDQDKIQEFEDLASSAGANTLNLITGTRRSPDSRYYIGSGKADQIRDLVDADSVELVIFDHELSPSQERNLEHLFQCRVLDRTGLILDIFAQRARSFEGKLQVELAQLRHLSTRLVRGWTHLERQKGGIGLRGPGETQLETDRRLLNQRIDQIKRRLIKVDRQREQGRRARQKAELPTVSLVGYTNAGKSTLFNQLTDAGVLVQDQLFATLDPTLRRLTLPEGGQLILADTVGFISRLPHELVAAFKSTLDETVSAALLLHLVDASSEQRDDQIKDVNTVLMEIGAGDVPLILVYNKIDQLEAVEPRIERDEQGNIARVWLSAQTGEGIDSLLEALEWIFREEQVIRTLTLSPDQGRLRALLFEQGQILEEECISDGGWTIKVQLSWRRLNQLLKAEPALALGNHE